MEWTGAADDAPQELPVTHAVERLLLDHAARLRDLVAELGDGTASADVTDVALAISHRGGQDFRPRGAHAGDTAGGTP